MAKYRVDLNNYGSDTVPGDFSRPWDSGLYLAVAEPTSLQGILLRKITQAWHDLLRWDRFPATADLEFLVRLRIPAATGDTFPGGGIFVRVAGVGGSHVTGVLFNLTPTSVGIHHWDDGRRTDLGAFALPEIAQLTYVWMRGRIAGDSAWVSAWVDGDAEPAWQHTATAEFEEAGGIGLYSFFTNRIELDYLAIGTAGDAPPNPGDTDPPDPPLLPVEAATPLAGRRVQYEVRVAYPGAPDVEGHVAFTIPGSLITNELFIPGPTIRPAQGRTETHPIMLEIIDQNEILTQHIADAAGRMRMLGRLVEVRRSLDYAAFTSIATGRLSDLSQPRGPGLWVMQIDDERWAERAQDIFTVADTTMLWPPGILTWWRSIIGRGYALPAWKTVGTEVGGRRRVEGSAYGKPIRESMLGWMGDDIVEFPELRLKDADGNPIAAQGNFVHSRLRIGTTDYEVITFGDLDGDSGSILDPLRDIDTSNALSVVRAWIIAPGPIQENATGYIYPGNPGEPDDTVPLHVGMGDSLGGFVHKYGTPSGSIHPFELVKRLYDEIGVRYDAAAIQLLIENTSYPPVAFRITQRWNAARFFEDHIFSVFGVIPFPGKDGRVVLRNIRLPEGIDPEALFRFHPGNTAKHPTFHHGSRDVVNQVVFRYLSLRQGIQAGTDDADADDVVTKELLITEDGSTIATLGKHPTEYNLLGNPPQHELQDWSIFMGPDRTDLGAGVGLESIMAKVRAEALQRFEDGPQRGTFEGMPETEVVQAGDYVVLDFPSYPNAVTSSLGGARIVQIMKRDLGLAGPDFEFLDIGPFLQPLAQPSITVVADLVIPDRIVITISQLPAGATALLEVGWGSSSVSPPSFALKYSALGAGAVVIDRVPELTTVWARVRSTAPQRVSSLWKVVKLAMSTAPRVLSALLVLDDVDLSLRVRTTPSVDLLRVFYSVYRIGQAAPDPLPNIVDVIASTHDGTLAVPGIVVPLGFEVAARIVPWKGAPGSGGAQAGPPLAVPPVQNIAPDAPAPVIEMRQTGTTETATNVQVSAYVTGGRSVELFYTIGPGEFPATSNLENGGVVSVQRSSNAQEDRILRIKAVPSFGLPAYAEYLVDWDRLPKISFVNTPTPIFDADREVIGWYLSGGVDDDTRALRWTFPAGIGIRAASPSLAEGSGSSWMDTTSTKTWWIELLQEPGASGVVYAVPCEFYPAPSFATPGTLGVAYEQRLSRPPQTQLETRELTITSRSLVFTVKPAGATLRFKLNRAPDWTTVQLAPDQNTHIESPVFLNGDTFVEWYAFIGDNIEERQERTIDVDTQPEITSLVLTEDPAGYLRVTVGLDDDIVEWKLWARKGFSPLVNGVPSDLYLKRPSGKPQDTSYQTKAGVGVWYVVVRGYDYAGQYSERAGSKEIRAVSTNRSGTISNIRVDVKALLSFEGGTTYVERVEWDHNDIVAAGGFVVEVVRNGQVAVPRTSGRDARTDAWNDTPGTAFLGGWQRSVVPADASTPGAVFRTNNYAVHLIKDGEVVMTANTSISRYYREAGALGEPTEVPAVPVVVNLGGAPGSGQATARADWSNTSGVWKIKIEWGIRHEFGGAIQGGFAVKELNAGITFDLQSYELEAGQPTIANARVCYTNDAGDGPWSGWSNSEYMGEEEGSDEILTG